MTNDFSFIHHCPCYVVFALLLLAYEEGLWLALGGVSGRTECVELNLGDEKLENPKNNAGVLACDWWNHSQGERTLKEQNRHDIDEFGFGYVAYEVSLRDSRRKMIYVFEYVLNFWGKISIRDRNF